MNTSYTTTRTLTQADFDTFARISGDNNPIHVDPVFSASTRFGRTVSHGMLLYGLLDAALQAWMPGAVQQDQSLMFTHPTYVGEELTIQLTLLEQHGAHLRIATEISKHGDVSVCKGETTLRTAP